MVSLLGLMNKTFSFYIYLLYSTTSLEIERKHFNFSQELVHLVPPLPKYLPVMSYEDRVKTCTIYLLKTF